MSKRGSLLITVLGLIWGTNFLFMKLAVEQLSALDVAMWRIAFGALPMLIIAWWRRQIACSDLRHWHHFLAMALLANLGPYIFFIIGTAHLPSGVAGAVAGSVPVITAALVSVALPSERPTVAMTVGLVLGLSGILLLSPIGNNQRGNDLDWIGVLSMLGGALSYAIALVYARRFIQPLELGSIRLAAWQMIFALAMVLPVSDPASIEVLVHYPGTLAGLVLGLGLIGTGVAFVIYYELIAELGALRAGAVYYIPPAVALAMGACFLNEQLGVQEIVGTVLILIGVFYASRKPHNI